MQAECSEAFRERPQDGAVGTRSHASKWPEEAGISKENPAAFPPPKVRIRSGCRCPAVAAWTTVNDMNWMDMKRDRSTWLLLLGVAALVAGCGARLVNLGAKDEPLTDGLKDPAALKAKVVVPAEQRLVSNFDDGTRTVNPKLFNGGGGSWSAFSYGGNTVNDPFVVPGGANGTPMAAHLFGTLVNKGDNQYPAFTLTFKPKAAGLYDAGAFTGIRFYYKCPPADKTTFRTLGIPIAATLPASSGGTCQDGCYNHFRSELPASADWTVLSLAFNTFKRQAGWGSPVNPPEFTDHLNEIVDFEWSNNVGNTAGSFPVDFWVDEVEFY